ncbi:MAG: glycosyl transferase family 28 [Actinomycetota bacterium]|nr:glycosyl transferase family 28 [Actinomycetota bacterium]
MSAAARQLGTVVFAAVGTDHHPFDRLVAWLDRWLALTGADAHSCFVQAGTSRPPERARSRAYLRHDEMEEAVRGATAVVTHAGPGTIMLCRYLGKTPIVVPRLQRLGEHVDDHQVLFARRLAAAGEIEIAETRTQFFALLDEAVNGGGGGRSERDPDVGEAVRQFEELVGGLLGGKRRDRAQAER